ncbi:homocysteine S-methyltransferase family protein [uncultured Nocardioides sp.]|uniref:endonuclease domain-containing protein n=1 Tax=uncultured Nocardioides sp. TaxID=198441 RepID=UPI00260E15A6|nr:homocysteine S-methyltransferase family protein [uncultured Nocardioides sp.]
MIDGAMGTAIQRDRPDEAGYRGERFKDWTGEDLQGNNDLLTVTQPAIVADIHREYLQAGADVIETNTFNANAVSLSDYGLEELAYELNLESARLARRVADEVATLERPRYVAGALGPTTRTASISPDVNDPAARNITWDDLVPAYLEAARGLVDGGAESPQETRLRLLLIRNGFPRPVTQIPVTDKHGRVIRRIDMGWPQHLVGIEYDGGHHWTDPDAHAADITRLEFLAARGWLIIRVSSRQLRYEQQSIVRRVASALRQRDRFIP